MKFNEYTKNLIKTVTKVSDVAGGFYYWQGTLLDQCMDIFYFEGLPASLPQEEVDRRLFTTGHAGVVNHPSFGLITCDSSLFDFDLYGRFRRANFFNPFPGFLTKGFTGQNLEIGKDCVMIYNNSLEKYVNAPILGRDLFMQCINRYARLLADCESTIDIELINNRQSYLPIAADEITKQGILDIFRNIRKGELFTAVDRNLYKDTTTLKTNDKVVGFLTELLDARQRILKEFQEEIGIFSIDDKEERIIEKEIDNEKHNVKIYIYSMLKAREIGCEQVNDMFGTNISVKLRSVLYDNSELYEQDTVDDNIETQTEVDEQEEDVVKEDEKNESE